MKAKASNATGAGASADLPSLAARSEGRGAVWTLPESEDLNANLLRFPAGEGVGEHTNREVDVVLVGVSGSGYVRVAGEEFSLGAGSLVYVPKDTPREVRAGTEDFACLSVHRRRAGIRIGRSGEPGDGL